MAQADAEARGATAEEMDARVAAAYIEGVLAGRSARDGVAMAAAGIVLMAVAILASLGPAWRAARIDPNRALRSE